MKRNTTFKRMLLNNLVLVLLVGLMMLSLVMLYSVNQSRIREQEKYEAEISQIQVAADEMFSGLLNSCTKIAANREFHPVNNKGGVPSYNMMQRLKDYFPKSVASDLLLIYADEAITYFYSPVGSMRSEQFDRYYRMANLPLSYLQEIALTDLPPFLTETKVFSDQTDMYVFLCPLNNFAYGMDAVAVFLIPQSTMLHYLHTAQALDERSVVIADKNGGPMLTTGKGLSDEEIRPLKLNAAQGKVGGRKFLRLHSSSFRWDYFLYYKLAGVTFLSILNILAFGLSAVLLGLWTALYFAKRSYKPIGAILQQYQLSGEDDAYTQLGALIDSLLVSLNESHTRTQLMKRSNCQLLLTGFYNGISEPELNDIFELPENVNSYCLMLIRPAVSLPEMRLSWYQTTLTTNSSALCVLADAADENSIASFARELGALHPECTIAVSEHFNELQTAPGQFMQLHYLLSFRFVSDSNVLFAKDKFDARGVNAAIDSFGFVRMYQALLNRDFDLAVAEAVQQLANLKSAYSPELQRQCVLYFYSVFSLCRTDFKDTGALNEACCRLRANQFEHFDALEQTVMDCIGYIRCQNDEAPTGSLPKKEQVLESINLHFTDQDFSLQSLADAFGVTASSMSKLFKSFMNTTLSDYVMHKRVALACTLLSDTQTPIREILEKVGYNDINNFYRRFKSVTGVTPAQFREHHGGVNSEIQSEQN